MRTDWKDYWIEEYKKAYKLYLIANEYDYDRGVAFGRSLSLSATLYLEYGFSVDAIDCELVKEFSNGCTD